MSLNIAVTEQEFHKAEKVFRTAASQGCFCVPAPAREEALARFVREKAIRHVILGVERYSGPLYEALSCGAVVARFGVGHDGVDKGKATERKLLCTNTPGSLDASVAEHTINLMLATARHTVALAGAVREGRWSPQIGSELDGKTLVIVGCGAIGRRVAETAGLGFRMRVVGLQRPGARSNVTHENRGFAALSTSYEEAVAGADYVSLHIPSVPETRHYLNRERLAPLTATCQVINTGRGALIDEGALFDAVSEGRLGGAALDVFGREPYSPVVPGKDLRRLPQIIMTPHVSSSTREACERVARQCLANIQSAERGAYLEMNLLNLEVVKKL